MDEPAEVILKEIMLRLGRSILQYVADSYPWTTGQGKAILAKLQVLVDEQRQAGLELSEFLRSRRVFMPFMGASYPSSFTHLNFVSLDYLLPQLLESEKQLVQDLESNAASLWSDLEAREKVQQILEMSRRHLKSLEELTAPAPASA